MERPVDGLFPYFGLFCLLRLFSRSIGTQIHVDLQIEGKIVIRVVARISESAFNVDGMRLATVFEFGRMDVVFVSPDSSKT